MQGANYQLDKEPLRQIPIAIPSDDIQEIIGKLVGIIILLNNTKNRASNLVQNSYISSEFETLIDGCVYEIYFPQEMQVKFQQFSNIKKLCLDASTAST